MEAKATRPERISAAIRPETKEIYEKLANAGGHTLSKSTGDFLEMMAPYAEFLSVEYKEAREKPKQAIKNASEMIEKIKWEMKVRKESSRGWKSDFESSYHGVDPSNIDPSKCN